MHTIDKFIYNINPLKALYIRALRENSRNMRNRRIYLCQMTKEVKKPRTRKRTGLFPQKISSMTLRLKVPERSLERTPLRRNEKRQAVHFKLFLLKGIRGFHIQWFWGRPFVFSVWKL